MPVPSSLRPLPVAKHEDGPFKAYPCGLSYWIRLDNDSVNSEDLDWVVEILKLQPSSDRSSKKLLYFLQRLAKSVVILERGENCDDSGIPF